ncbi:hypothetical protein ACSBR1_031020 [Camellia fascicularis]
MDTQSKRSRSRFLLCGSLFGDLIFSSRGIGADSVDGESTENGQLFANSLCFLLLARVIAVTFCVTLATSLAARLGATPTAAFQFCLQFWMTSSLLSDGLAIAGQVLVSVVSIASLFLLWKSHGFVGIWFALTIYMGLRAFSGILR